MSMSDEDTSHESADGGFLLTQQQPPEEDGKAEDEEPPPSPSFSSSSASPAADSIATQPLDDAAAAAAPPRRIDGASRTLMAIAAPDQQGGGGGASRAVSSNSNKKARKTRTTVDGGRARAALSSSPQQQQQQQQQHPETLAAAVTDENLTAGPTTAAAIQATTTFNSAATTTSHQTSGTTKFEEDEDFPAGAAANDEAFASESSSSGSSSSSDDDDDDDDGSDVDVDPEQPSLQERRRRNVKRNASLLESLGLAHGVKPPAAADGASRKRRKTAAAFRAAANVQDGDDDDNPEESARGGGRGRRAGMLLPGALLWRRKNPAAMQTAAERQQQSHRLEALYPGRRVQIRKLSALLSCCAATTTTTNNKNNNNSNMIPPPIFVTGGNGTGKTSIVRDVVHQQVDQQQQQQNSTSAAVTTLAHAYVDCATLDVSSIEELVVNAYCQLEAPFAAAAGRARNVRSAAGERLKDLFGTELGTRSQRTAVTAATAKAAAASAAMDPGSSSTTTTNNNNNSRSKTSIVDDDNSTSAIMVETMAGEATVRRQSARNSGKRAARKIAVHKAAEQAKHQDISGGSQPQQQQSSNHLTAVWMFGRAVESLLLGASCNYRATTSTAAPPAAGAAVLVLDHAERLMTLGSSAKGGGSSQSDRINFLAQLLLLPRTLGINLTLIVVAKSVMLENTCLNNMSSQGTITSQITPIRLHFPAYRGKSIIKAILCQEKMRCLITVGEAVNGSPFADKVFQSFVGTLVQSLHDLTTDIKEFVRLGRTLWPRYSSLIRPSNIHRTLELIRKSKKISSISVATDADTAALERDILSFLDQKIFPSVRYAIEHGLGTLAFALPASIPKTKLGDYSTSALCSAKEVPFLAKFLLLSAYVCQVNRAERDKQLFTIEKNGRKARGGAASRNTEEETAFGSNAGDQWKSRPRTYPAERLYSLYVSMVSLNPSKELTRTNGVVNDDENEDEDDPLKSLGNIYFHETVAYLKSIGILHDFPQRSPNDPIRLSQRNLWSSITKEEAQQVAKSVNFPLDRYIL